MKDRPGVLTRPKDATSLAKVNQFAGDAIQLGLLYQLFPAALGSAMGAHLGRNHFSVAVAWACLGILYESGSGCCAARWCKMHVHACIVID